MNMTLTCPNCKHGIHVDVEPVIIASGEDFEKYLCDQINTLGCAKCEMTKTTGDQGVDLLVTLEGGERVAVQCKLYSSPVGNDAVQQVIAGKMFYGCDRAMVVTNNTYTQSAEELAKATGVELLNYKDFKGRIDELGGGFRKRVLSEVFSYTCSGQPLEHFAKKLKITTSVLLGENVELNEISSALKEAVDFGRNPMPATQFAIADLMTTAVGRLPAMAERGEFGDGLKNVMRERYATNACLNLDEAKKASLDQMMESIELFVAYYSIVKGSEDLGSPVPYDSLPVNICHLLQPVTKDMADDALATFRASVVACTHYVQFLFGEGVGFNVNIGEVDFAKVRRVIKGGYEGMFGCVYCGAPLAALAKNCMRCGKPVEDSMWQFLFGETHFRMGQT